jgi:hypothetical protein
MSQLISSLSLSLSLSVISKKYLFASVAVALLFSGCAAKAIDRYALVGSKLQTCDKSQTIAISGLSEKDANQGKILYLFIKQQFEDGFVEIDLARYSFGALQSDKKELYKALQSHSKELGACVVAHGVFSEYGTDKETEALSQWSSSKTPSSAPNAVSRFILALFFARVTPSANSLDVLIGALPEQSQRGRASRHGAVVIATLRGGNADRADIFADDILLSVNGELCRVPQSYTNGAASTKRTSCNELKVGADNNVEIWRDGQILNKIIKP